ncbi:uncharacterized protein J3D65DRAFT_651305 [Phyllosticta citribraziliensis]|uniref:Carboxymuconolactone decarboxylase-like domain-containing protein n=1 Tax=Phyllosticta citribraziliensis TaxID=989973 RepID=A0ABR1LR31_9PEZI
MVAPVLDIHSLTELFPHDPRGLEYSIAYVYAAAALLAFAAEKRVAELWQQIAAAHAGNPAAQGTAARRVREALLKATPLVGFPRGINGLAILRTAVQGTSPRIAAEIEQDQEAREHVPVTKRQKRGKEFFRRLYAQHTERVLHNLNISSGGVLGDVAVTCVYGDLMADERVLNAKESALMEFVCCYAVSAAPQAKGHMYGARNMGNSGVEICAAAKLVSRIAEALQVKFDAEEMNFVEKVRAW